MKIGDLSKLLGISTDTIRLYESLNIISPIREDTNRYREYGEDDICFLLDCLKLKSMGISNKNISHILHDEPVDFLNIVIRERKKKLKNEIEEKRKLIQYIDKYSELLETIEYNCDNIWIRKVPKKYLLKRGAIEIGYNIDIEKEADIAVEWLKNVPFIEYGRLYSFDNDSFSEDSTKVEGVYVAETEIIINKKLPLHENIICIPEHLAITKIISAEKTKDVTPEVLSALKNIQKAGYKISIEKNVIAVILARVCSKKQPQRYLKLDIPIEMK